MKVLGPTLDSQPGDLVKGLGISRSEGRMFDCRTSTELGETETLGRHKQSLVHSSTQEKGEAIPQEAEPDLPLSVWGLLQRCGSAVACSRVRGTGRGSPGR